MLKRHFIARVAAKCRIPAAQVSAMLDATRDVAAEQLIDTGAVRIPGMAVMKVLQRASRMARNPKTGRQYPVASGHTVKARPVTALSVRVASRLAV